MKRLNRFFFLLAGIAALVSCEALELDDLLDNPNALRPDQISLSDGLNGVQLAANALFGGASGFGETATRHRAMFGTTYENAYAPGTGAGVWNNAYATILLDSSQLLERATEAGQLEVEGVTRILRAYTLMVLVDHWGDVPFTEAFQGVGNFSPAVTPGAEVYAAALEELNLAIAALDASDGEEFEGGNVTNFFFSNRSTGAELKESWTRLANSLKYKYYLNLGDVAGMNAAVSDGVIEDINDSFAFQYGTVNDPESRHPLYVGNYGDENPDGYMNVDFMFQMVNFRQLNEPATPGTAQGLIDPRANFYFYRQTDEFPGVADNPSIGDALPCFDDPNPYPAQFGFCSFGEGFWGRDHGNSDGIPPDGNLRTVYGVYPAGGDANESETDITNSGTRAQSFGAISDEDGLNGEGVNPIMPHFMMYMLRAEGALVYGTNDDAETMLRTAVAGSFDYVYQVAQIDSTLDPDGAGIAISRDEQADNYVDYVFDELYSGNELRTLGQQMWFASFGNGYEMYNFYRRNGEAAIMLQPHLLGAGAGPFPRSLFYITNTADLNLSIDQKPSLTQNVFWDNNGSIVQ